MAFNAPHAPLHALEEDCRKYEGCYARGWDAVRMERLEHQKAMDLFAADHAVPARPDHVPAWDELPEDTRDREEKRITTLAAMIDRVDQEIGRVVADLEANGGLDSTIILFFSDNGACPYDRRNIRPDLMPWDHRTRWTDSTGWAWVRNTPFRLYKQIPVPKHGSPTTSRRIAMKPGISRISILKSWTAWSKSGTGWPKKKSLRQSRNNDRFQTKGHRTSIQAGPFQSHSTR